MKTTEHVRFTHGWRDGSIVCDCGVLNCKAPITISYRQWLEWRASNPGSVISGLTVEYPGEEEEARINKEFARDMAEVARIRALPRDELNRPIEDENKSWRDRAPQL